MNFLFLLLISTYYYCKSHAKNVNDLKTTKLHAKSVKNLIKNRKNVKRVLFIIKKKKTDV